jgi:hypothetical protein
MIMLVVMVVTQVTQHKIYAFVRIKEGIVPIQHVTEPLHKQFHVVRKKNMLDICTTFESVITIVQYAYEKIKR